MIIISLLLPENMTTGELGQHILTSSQLDILATQMRALGLCVSRFPPCYNDELSGLLETLACLIVELQLLWVRLLIVRVQHNQMSSCMLYRNLLTA